MRPVRNLTIPITLARHVDEPLHEQIAGQVGAAIRDGLLAPRAQLPSTRSLATLLGVSRGVAIAAYGVANVVKAYTQKFRKDLNEGQMSPTVRRWAARSGVVGHAARGIVFGIVGWFLTKAALDYDPDEAVGIDGALAQLADRAYGTWLLAAVALGLLAYGVFCLVQARYRRV